MQSTHKIAGSAAAGFAAYLTTSASRGDYYVGGEIEGDGGAWHGSPEALDELGLDPSQQVRKVDLVSLMEGRSPASGEPIRRVGGDGSRVAGIDATFSAPKSVSALWAVSDPYRRAQIEVAHRKAVASALGRIERDVEVVRRRERGELRWERARSLVAAAFVHTSSRLTRDQERDGVPDPQLHSHIVIVAAEREDGRFAAVDSRELFRSQRASGAWYRAELAHELRGLGLEIRSRTGRDGRFFELKGVPDDLSKRWSRRREVIEKAAREFRDRYGRAPNRGELGSIAVATRGTKTMSAAVDVSSSWRAVGEEYGLSRDRVEQLFNQRSRESERDVRSELLADVTRNRSMVETRELEARAFELAAGVERPQAAREHLAELERSGELARLEGGWWTTRELRQLEQQALSIARERSAEQVGVALNGSHDARRGLVLHPRHPHALSYEQRDALGKVTGPGGVVVLVGEAGTGKGVLLDAARQAWEHDGYRVVGTAIAGATAQRLGADAQIELTMTTDALIHRVDHDRLHLDERTVVVMDEAGMADTRRLARLIQITDHSRSKLVLAGDSAQLSSIGAGGLFGELKDQVPSAQLTHVYRAHHEWERQAWRQVREGNAQGALARYRAHDRLHVQDTREQAAERMVKDWAQVRDANPRERVVMITDASNHELDRINQQAQQERVDRGELGAQVISLPDRPYGLRQGDLVIFTAPHQPRWGARVENGTQGEVRETRERDGSVVIYTKERSPRDIDVSPKELDRLRLAYAQHVYKAQGLTTDRALVLTGGWQTDRETSYVALTRAREQTDIYTSREDLGHAGVNTDLVERLADRVHESRAQQASITREEQRVDPIERERTARSVDDARIERDQLRETVASYPRQALESISALERDHAYLNGRVRDMSADADRFRTLLDATSPRARESENARSLEQSIAQREQLADRARREEQETLAKLSELRDSPEQPLLWEERHPTVRENLKEAEQAFKQAVEHEVDQRLQTPGEHILGVLGQRPDQDHQPERDSWDHAARRIETYRVEHQVNPDERSALGPKPDTTHENFLQTLQWEGTARDVLDARYELDIDQSRVGTLTERLQHIHGLIPEQDRQHILENDRSHGFEM